MPEYPASSEPSVNERSVRVLDDTSGNYITLPLQKRFASGCVATLDKEACYPCYRCDACNAVQPRRERTQPCETLTSILTPGSTSLVIC
jgi:hypothetical protein